MDPPPSEGSDTETTHIMRIAEHAHDPGFLSDEAGRMLNGMIHPTPGNALVRLRASGSFDGIPGILSDNGETVFKPHEVRWGSHLMTWFVKVLPRGSTR